jgi:hypothetical protein
MKETSCISGGQVWRRGFAVVWVSEVPSRLLLPWNETTGNGARATGNGRVFTLSFLFMLYHHFS